MYLWVMGYKGFKIIFMHFLKNVLIMEVHFLLSEKNNLFSFVNEGFLKGKQIKYLWKTFKDYKDLPY